MRSIRYPKPGAVSAERQGRCARRCSPLATSGAMATPSILTDPTPSRCLVASSTSRHRMGTTSSDVRSHADNALGLPLCPEEIFADGDDGLTLKQPRALAADALGNVYAAGRLSGNVIWIRPEPADKTKMIPQEIINRSAGLDAPQAIAVDSQGNVYVSGSTTNNVFRIRTIAAGLACGNGRREKGETCEYTLDCCCSVTCNAQQQGVLCRGSVGDCDVADTCDGTNGACSDTRHDASTVCRPVIGSLCDVEEHCDGKGTDCPKDAFLGSETTCRAAKGSCDVAERCTGTGPDCPPDSVQPHDTVCRPAATGKSCDRAELCDGTSAFCPVDTALAPSTGCTLSADDIGTADVACLNKEGSCSEDGNCMPVPLIDHVCFPPDLAGRDPRCFKSNKCDASGQCKVESPSGRSAVRKLLRQQFLPGR